MYMRDGIYKCDMYSQIVTVKFILLRINKLINIFYYFNK